MVALPIRGVESLFFEIVSAGFSNSFRLKKTPDPLTHALQRTGKMSRILLGMAGLNAIILLVTFAVGFACEGRAQVRPDEPLTDAQQIFTFHLLGGLAATLLSLMLHSIVFTYFIGTGRWVQEVVKAYGLPGSIWEHARALK